MLSLFHTIISVPFGIFFQNPLLAFIAAFTMHFICDHLLHWNIYPQNFKKYPYALVALDVIGGLIAAYMIAGNSIFNVSVIAAIAGGNMPDVLHALWSMLQESQRKKFPNFIHRYFDFHEGIQRETDSVPRGLLSQITLGTLAIIITRVLL